MATAKLQTEVQTITVKELPAYVEDAPEWPLQKVWGVVDFLAQEFDIPKPTARRIVESWMKGTSN